MKLLKRIFASKLYIGYSDIHGWVTGKLYGVDTIYTDKSSCWVHPSSVKKL